MNALRFGTATLALALAGCAPMIEGAPEGTSQGALTKLEPDSGSSLPITLSDDSPAYTLSVTCAAPDGSACDLTLAFALPESSVLPSRHLIVPVDGNDNAGVASSMWNLFNLSIDATRGPTFGWSQEPDADIVYNDSATITLSPGSHFLVLSRANDLPWGFQAFPLHATATSVVTE